MKSVLLCMALFFVSGIVIGHEAPSDQMAPAFRDGYTEGYEHGIADGRNLSGFDSRHSRSYSQPGSQHGHYQSHRDCDFQLGYLEGYADGYFEKEPLVPVESAAGIENNGATIFSERAYRGYAQFFGIGQYPRLEGKLHDSVESVRIEGRVRVILFDDRDFKGSRVVVETNTFDLERFRNKAESMIIEPAYRR